METIISIFLAFIAYKQWKTEEETKRLALFDKRFIFYEHFMLNPLWNILFYNKDEILIKNDIVKKTKPPEKNFVEQASFLFPKRTYNKIVLAYYQLHGLTGRQEVINEIKVLGTEKIQDKDEAKNALLVAEFLEDELTSKNIDKLKKQYKSLINDIYPYIAIEKQITIWGLLRDMVVALWDFIIPYESKILKHNENLSKEMADYYQKLKKEKQIKCRET